MTDFPALHGRASGLVRIDGGRLVFTPDLSAASAIEIELAALEISLETGNSHHFILTDPRSRESAICVQDLRAIERLASLGVRAARAILEQSQAKKRRRLAIVSSPVALGLALIVAIPVLLAMIPVSWLDGILTHRQERAIGQTLLRVVAPEFLSVKPQAESVSATRLVQYLRDRNPALDKIEFRVLISNNKEINAFALPGGIIVMNRGLIDSAVQIEEVLGVLAHEVAHVERRHTIKSLASSLGAVVGTAVLGSIVGSDAALWVARASNLVSLKYSRGDETEADKRGFEFLKNAKVSASGMIAFFTRLQEKEAALASVGSAMSIFSTHPLSRERVAALRALSEANSFHPSIDYPVTLEELRAAP